MLQPSSQNQPQRIVLALMVGILLLGAVSLSNMTVWWAVANEIEPLSDQEKEGIGQLSNENPAGFQPPHKTTAEDEPGDRSSFSPIALAPSHGQRMNNQELQIGLESFLWVNGHMNKNSNPLPHLSSLQKSSSEISSPTRVSQQTSHRDLPANEVNIRVENEYRYITANGLPAHDTGRFPNPNNPNAITEQSHNFRLLVNPQVSDRITPNRGFLFGVALNGVPFDPGTGETWNGDRRWHYEALTGAVELGIDHNHAHVQPGGTYHYHGTPTGLVVKQTKQPSLIGYAADGFPIYASQGYHQPEDASSGIREIRSSYRLKAGDRPANSPPGSYDGSFALDYEYIANAGDLDECNGRFGVTPEYPEGTYHYYVTEEFPFVSRCFRGTPDDSFQKRGGRHGAPPRPGGNASGRPSRPPQGGGGRPRGGSRRPPFPPLF